MQQAVRYCGVLVAFVRFQDVRTDVDIIESRLRERSIDGAHRLVGLLRPAENQWLPILVAVLAPLSVCATTDGEMGIAFGVTEHRVQERAVKCCRGNLAIRARLAYARSVLGVAPGSLIPAGGFFLVHQRPPPARWLKTAFSRTICSAVGGGPDPPARGRAGESLRGRSDESRLCYACPPPWEARSCWAIHCSMAARR